MARKPITISADASARDVVDALDPVGWQGLSGRLERIEEVLAGMSRRARLLLLNALLKGELDAAKAAKPGRRV